MVFPTIALFGGLYISPEIISLKTDIIELKIFIKHFRDFLADSFSYKFYMDEKYMVFYFFKYFLYAKLKVYICSMFI